MATSSVHHGPIEKGRSLLGDTTFTGPGAKENRATCNCWKVTCMNMKRIYKHWAYESWFHDKLLSLVNGDWPCEGWPKACDSELLYSYIHYHYTVSDHISVAYLSCTQAISETRPDSRMRVPASLVEWGVILAVLESGWGLCTCVWKCTSLSPLIAPVYHCCSKSKSGDQALLAPLLKRNVNYYS